MSCLSANYNMEALTLKDCCVSGARLGFHVSLGGFMIQAVGWDSVLAISKDMLASG